MKASARSLSDRFPMPLLAAAGVLFVYEVPLLLLRGLPLGGDELRQYYPAEHVLAQALRRGTLPFWTPNLQAGFPLFAEAQPSELSPINLLALLLLPTPVAHNAIIVAHQFLGLLFTFWWGRALRLSRGAAAWMALVFAQTSWLAGDDILLIEVTCWVPLVFLTAERLQRDGRTLSAVVTVPALALLLLGGFPQVAAYTVLGASIYLAARVCGEPLSWPVRVRTIVLWGAAILLALMLAAPQLLPQYELGQFSIRARGVSAQFAGEKSLLPPALMTLILPTWLPFFSQAGLGMGVYLGLLPCLLALAIMSGGSPRPRWVWSLAAVAVVATLMSLGKYSPIFPLLRRLPGLAFFRYPSRFMFMTHFCLITFFGLGWDRVTASAIPPFDRALRRLFFAAAALVSLNVAVLGPLLRLLRAQATGYAARYVERYVASNPFHIQPAAYYQAKIDALYDSLLAATSWQDPRATLALFLAVAGCLTLLWTGDHPSRRRWRPLLLGGIILVDVLLFAGVVRHVDPVALVTEPPATLRELDLGGPPPCRTFWLTDAQSVTRFRENRARFIANYNLLFDVPTTGVYAPLGFDAYYRLMEGLGTIDLGFGQRPVTAANLSDGRRILDFLNVCYVLSHEPLPGFDAGRQIGGVWIYRNERASPRVFAVDRVEVAESVDSAVKWVRTHPERLRDTAVIDAPLATALAPGAARGATVRVADYQSTRARIEVSAPSAVLLVMSDTHYPGWQAFIDDAAVPLYRANAAFRAVMVPAGRHRVELRFVPTTFRVGLAVAALAALATIAWAMLAGRSTT